MSINFCRCGCGTEIKSNRIFVHNHHMIGKRHSEQTKNLMRQSKLGTKLTEKTKNKMRLSHLGKPNPISEKGRENIRQAMTKTNKTILTQPKYVKRRVESCKKSGYHLSEKGRQNIIAATKNRVFTEEAHKKMSKAKDPYKEKFSQRMKECWKDDNYRSTVLPKMLTINSPNKAELKLLNLLNGENFGIWKFVGNGKVVIGGKNPDFVNQENKIIELWGDYWHKNDNEEERIKHFAKYGWDTLIIWTHEMKNKDGIKEKIISFLGVK